MRNFNFTKKTNILHGRNIILLTLSVVFIYNLSTVGFAQEAEDTTPPVIKIRVPEEGKRYVLDEYSIYLSFTIRDDSRLKTISAEVLGEHTGTFFIICGEDQTRCNGDPPDFEYELYCPVFEGWNVLKITVIDEAGNDSEISKRFFVFPSTPEALRGCDEADIVSLPTTQLMKKQISQETPPGPAPPTLEEGQYDLLILTHEHEGFEGPLFRLMVHKNSTGMPTRLVTLEQIYESPKYRGRDHAETIKKALAEFKEWWQIKYVMLVGDSDRFPIRYTKIYDLGHWGHGFAPSDLYYADLFDRNGDFDSWDYDNDNLFGEMQGNFPKDANDLNQDRINLFPDVAVGRIPVSNYIELDTYVNKVIHYETTADPSWYKKGLLITGSYPNSIATNDFVANQLQSQSFQIIKLYHDQIWPTTTMTQRRNMIENELNDGVGFVSYVGHGKGVKPSFKDGGKWGGWYYFSDIPSLNNENKLPVIFSAACETAMFGFGRNPYFAKWGYEYKEASYTTESFNKYRWAPEPIALVPDCYDVDALAEHFLVKGAMGGIAFIGSYTGTQGGAPKLTKYFFEAYGSGITILGDLWNAAIRKYIVDDINQLGYIGHSWYTSATYHHIHKMLLFGDPSLRLGGVKPDLIAIPDRQGNYCKIENGKLVVTVRNQGSGSASASVTQVDFFRYGRFTTATPALDRGQELQLFFNIPAGCFDSDCEFKITIDAMSEVEESNEGNNSYSSTCTG